MLGDLWAAPLLDDEAREAIAQQLEAEARRLISEYPPRATMSQRAQIVALCQSIDRKRHV